MRIYTMTATFGKLENQTLRLQPGLNIIQAPNEWGKSTWCAFLIAMLYGIDTNARASKGVLPDKTRYAPWSGRPMSGRMELSWNGRDITIERNSKGRVPMGLFSAYETHTHLPVPELTASNCGQMLLGVERSVFTRAGFLKFTDLPVTLDETLRQRLNALVTTGDESGSAEDFAKKLKNLKNSCRHNRTGQLPQAEAQRDMLLKKCRDLADLQEQIHHTKDRQQSLAHQKAALLNHRGALEYASAQNYMHNVATAQAKCDLAEAHLKELSQRCEKLPPQPQLEKALSQLHTLREQRDALHMEAQMQAGPPAMPNAPAPFRGCEPATAVQQAQEDYAKYSSLSGTPKKVSPLLLLSGSILLLAGIVLMVLRLWIPGGISGALGLILCAIGLWQMTAAKKEAQAQQSQAQDLLSRYAPLPPEQWVLAAEQYAQQEQNYRNALSTYQKSLSGLELRMRQLQTQADALTGGSSMVQKEQEITSALELYRSYDDAMRTFRQAEDTLQALQASRKEVQPPEFPDTLSYTEAETARLLSDAEAQLRGQQLRLGQLQGQMEALGQPEELERQLLQVQERIKKLEDYYEAISLALAKLEDATAELQRRFAPQISKDAQALFNTLTAGRYTRLNLGADLSLQVATDEDVTLHCTQYPSDGTVDQLYLALRLAVAKALTPEAPLILDDALVRFDDDRLALAMEVLKQQAQHRQVIVFTCQSRESSYQEK